MSNPFDDTRQAVQEARAVLRAADQVAFNMAFLLRDRLRQVEDASTLRALKRELRDFDMVKGVWTWPPRRPSTRGKRGN